MGESQDNLPEPSRVMSISVDQYAALGQKVQLALGKRRTVLVGHNGAGKSALLEAIQRGLDNPFMHAVVGVPGEPHEFAVSIHTAQGSVSYAYKWAASTSVAHAPPPMTLATTAVDWFERLTVSNEAIWRLDHGEGHWLDDPRPIVGARGASIVVNPEALLPQDRSLFGRFGEHAVAEAMRTAAVVCQSSRHVRAGIPSAGRERSPLSFLLAQGGKGWRPTTNEKTRSVIMFGQLLKSRDEDRPLFDEFVGVCGRLQIFSAFDFFEFSAAPSVPSDQRLGAFFCDGANVGFLSDGTLRVMEIVWTLLNTPPGALLTIEEPETGIHPGLLEALFDEIDAYLGDRQIVISTHSPTVVDRVRPDELRLVTRADGKTSVQEISGTAMHDLRTYLHHHGDLGEFVFEGGLQ